MHVYILLNVLITFLLITLTLSSVSFSQNETKKIKKEFYFESNSSLLNKNELNVLNKYLRLIDKFNLIRIEISGYTDSDGNENYNQKLSQKRVNTIVELVKKKNVKTKLITKAKGEKNPTYDNNSLEKKKNRRVEVLIYYSTKKNKGCEKH